MLIIIDSSVVDVLNDGGGIVPHTLEALENISISRREGKHLVFSDRNTLKYLLNCVQLSERARKIYKRIYEESTQFKAYLSVFSRHVIVCPLLTVPTSIISDGVVITSLPVSYFNDTAIIQPTSIVSENNSDTLFYIMIAKTYFAMKKLGSIRINYIPNHGGGSTVNNVYKEIQDRNNCFCLCIVDSDKKSPSSNFGDTAKKLISVDNPDVVICNYFVLNVHEVENLIPYSFLSEASRSQKDRMIAVEFIHNLDISNNPELRKYIDIKNGTYLKDVFHTKELIDYWIGTKPPIQSMWPCDINDDCFSATKCNDKDHCACKCSPGLGENILNDAFMIMNGQSLHKIAEAICPVLKPEWEYLGKEIASWCCASSRLTA